MDRQTERSSSSLATPMIAGLTLITLGVVCWLFARHNVWAVVFLLWTVVQAVFLYWQWAVGKARVLLPWFVISVAALLAFSVFAPVPLTTISMELNKRSISAAVTLNTVGETTARRGSTDPRALGWLDTDWVSRHSIGRSSLSLYFGNPVSSQTREFEIRFGKHPARFSLAEIGIGSDILGLAYPLTTWRGEQIVESGLFQPRRSKLTTLDSGDVELLGPNTRPTLGVTVNRANVLSDASSSRETGYRLIWAFIFLFAPCLFLAMSRSARKIERLTRSIATWLTS